MEARPGRRSGRPPGREDYAAPTCSSARRIRSSLIGYAVPTGWAKNATRSSSIIHRTWAAAARRSAAGQVRWMIEELRVAFFAQPVGTAYPISEERVLRALEQVAAA